MTRPFSVLFVCTGNICRSPTAEAFFRHRIKEARLEHRFVHDSAGTSAYHTGEPPDARSQAALKSLGITMGDLRARQIREEDYYAHGLILGMDRSHVSALKRLAPADATAHIALYIEYALLTPGEVPDPYYGNAQDFEHVAGLLDSATSALLDRLKHEKL